MNKRRRRKAKARRERERRWRQFRADYLRMLRDGSVMFHPQAFQILGFDTGEDISFQSSYRVNPPTTVHVTEHQQEPNGDHTLKVEDRQVGIRMRYIREWDLVETKKFDIG